MKKLLFLVSAGLFLLTGGSVVAQNTSKKVTVSNLYGLKLEPADSLIYCRTIPFLAAPASQRAQTVRSWSGSTETIPVGGVQANTIFLLGMINEWWDHGLAHWSEHAELHEVRQDQVQIGTQIGEIEIVYTDGTRDRFPVTMGATAWFFNQWKFPDHAQKDVVREPFASRKEYMDVFTKAIKLKESGGFMSPSNNYMAYYLPVKPRELPIQSIVIHNNDNLRGTVLVSGVTVELPKGAQPAANMMHFGKKTVASDDLASSFSTYPAPDFSASLKALSGILYTSNSDIPEKVELLSLPAGFKGATIRFISQQAEGDMLSNIWVSNLVNMDRKFDAKTGFFHETGEKSPYYGGYMGIGTWAQMGVYRDAYARSTDHYARLALKCIDNTERITSFVDFCDKWLYFFRSGNDPEKGPDNSKLDRIETYPEDAPPHWTFVMNIPEDTPFPMNEIPGTEEMEGHSATIVTRWYSWKLLGMPTDDWMTQPRTDVYRKSRWQSTKDATEFICWLMDRTGMDVVYSEGEFTGWAGKFGKIQQIPKGMDTETDIVKIRKNYANSDMYEPYGSYSSMTALLCSADMADVMREPELAKKYRSYANRIREAMLRLLAHGSNHNRMWRVGRNSILPALQDCLVQAWFGLYREGLDPEKMDEDMTPITQNTLNRQLAEKYGDSPVLGMGYGIGWLTHSALVLDRMDNAGRLLTNIAKYTYDKNMDYVDPARSIDWRQWTWIIPEGVNIMPDGRWYRICDLSNGANQGPVMNALEVCAGIDDSNPKLLRVIPRIPAPLTGIEVTDFSATVERSGGKTERVHVQYTYERGKSFVFKSDAVLPNLDIRFGPYSDNNEATEIANTLKTKGGTSVRTVISGTYQNKPAYWVWIEGLSNIKDFSISEKGM